MHTVHTYVLARGWLYILRPRGFVHMLCQCTVDWISSRQALCKVFCSQELRRQLHNTRDMVEAVTAELLDRQRSVSVPNKIAKASTNRCSYRILLLTSGIIAATVGKKPLPNRTPQWQSTTEVSTDVSNTCARRDNLRLRNRCQQDSASLG